MAELMVEKSADYWALWWAGLWVAWKVDKKAEMMVYMSADLLAVS